MKMKIKKNDLVKVLYGKDAGKEGKVLKVFNKTGKVLVEGVNVYKRHVKGDGRTRQSEIVDIVKPMDVAKVMLVCPECRKSTRVGIKIEKNGKTRICKKFNKSVDVVEKENVDESKKEKSTDKKEKSSNKKDNKKK